MNSLPIENFEDQEQGRYVNILRQNLSSPRNFPASSYGQQNKISGSQFIWLQNCMKREVLWEL